MTTQGFLHIYPESAAREHERALRRGVRQDAVRRIMNRKADLFTRDARLKTLIGNRLGWVDSASTMKRKLTQIERLGAEVLNDGIRHVVLMGMGGSSLCPEVFGIIFGGHPKLRTFQVIDSTDPAAIRAVRKRIDLKKTLFLVASKSGGTVETRSHEAFFLSELRAAGVRNVGRQFAAITDPGSDLQKFARRNRYRKIFLNPSDIGGRYSALSYFGLVPAYFAGVDLRRFLDDAIKMERLLRDRADETNPALQLGAIMAGASKAGRDKMTVLASKRTVPFIPWVEQLVAESTGKKGRGIFPIEGEPFSRAGRLGKDRFLLTMRTACERDAAGGSSDLARRSKTPHVDIVIGNELELGGQFLLWEAATSVASYLMGINPFDEPNVTESKNITNKLLSQLQESATTLRQEPLAVWGKLSLLAMGGKKKYRKADMKNPATLLKSFVRGLRPPHYLSLLGYFKADAAIEKQFARIQADIGDRTGIAVLRGYGPRYLHSIGQLYKGGPTNGAFIIFVRNKYGRLQIPGRPFGFGQLIRAQAEGDAQALMKRGLPVLLIGIDGSPASALESFARAVAKALKRN